MTLSGQQAEQLALDHLQQQGLRLLARNWRGPRGELDLIMVDGDTLVFVEVRYRKQPGFGGAIASVDLHKQRRLIHTAQCFLQRQPRWASQPCRFDVVALGPAQDLNWINNAFDA